jgi:hypothetical protein
MGQATVKTVQEPHGGKGFACPQLQVAFESRQSTEGPADMAGEVVSVMQKEKEPLSRVIPGQQANGYFGWAFEQQESCLIHGYLQAVEKPSTLSRKAETPA